MNFKKLMLASILLFSAMAAFSQTASSQTIKIDFSFNTKAPDSKNYLKWSTSTAKIKDCYDAVSGASKKHSTGETRNAFFEQNRNLTPKGLRALLLFAVSSEKYMDSDQFKITQENKKLTIEFTHRGVPYKIISDNNGKLNLESSFFLQKSAIKPPSKLQSVAADDNEDDDEDSQSSDGFLISTGASKDKLDKAQDKKDSKADSKIDSNPAEKEQKDLPAQESAATESGNLEEEKNATPAQKTETKSKEDETPEGFDRDISESTEKSYVGTLKTQITPNGILRIKGKIKLLDKKIDESKTNG